MYCRIGRERLKERRIEGIEKSITLQFSFSFFSVEFSFIFYLFQFQFHVLFSLFFLLLHLFISLLLCVFPSSFISSLPTFLLSYFFHLYLFLYFLRLYSSFSLFFFFSIFPSSHFFIFPTSPFFLSFFQFYSPYSASPLLPPIPLSFFNPFRFPSLAPLLQLGSILFIIYLFFVFI